MAAFGGFGTTPTTPSPFGAGTGFGGGTQTTGGGFGFNTGAQARPGFGGLGSTSQTGGWGSTTGQTQSTGGFGSSPFSTTPGTGQNLFGGTSTMTSGAQNFQQQQLQLEQQQREFWIREFDLIRDTYTPANVMNMPMQTSQRLTDYKFQFRVVDTSTGVPREQVLPDHKAVEVKLQSQRAEMEKVARHIVQLHQTVQGLHDQSRAAKDRLEACRENSLNLTRRFLVVLQRMHVMHNINRPFDARDKDVRDRLDAMIGRLEDAVRTLNDVAGVVDEQEADMREHQWKELTCSLEPEDLDLLQQALEKQQQGLDFVTKTLRRDLQGIEVLKEKLASARPTF